MNYFLKKHKITLHTKGPVFIGDGKQLVKNEYILDKKRGIVHIIDQKKFLYYLRSKNLLDYYEKFILGKLGNLQSWLLYDQKIPYGDIESFLWYSLDCDGIAKLNTMKNILTFRKDAYGLPYIPGSSLKGAIRTVLLGADVIDNREKYDGESSQIKRAVYNPRAPKSYLEKAIETVESKHFNTKEKEKKRKEDIRNDCMSGLRISDSKPLSVSDLTLCQKIDIHTDGTEKNLPILRECLKPGTKVEFDVSIDHGECGFTPKDILASVDAFLESYNNLFLKNFKFETLFDKGVIYLGGGSGFATKTVLHQLLDGQKDRVKTVSKVIENTLAPKAKNKHKHSQDEQLGVSPHVCKLTEYDGELYQMGACRIEIV